MSVKALKHCINILELPLDHAPHMEPPALFTTTWQLLGQGQPHPHCLFKVRRKTERQWAGGGSDKPTTTGCGLLGGSGHLSAPLFWPWSLRLGRAAREGLGSAGCPCLYEADRPEKVTSVGPQPREALALLARLAWSGQEGILLYCH